MKFGRMHMVMVAVAGLAIGAMFAAGGCSDGVASGAPPGSLQLTREAVEAQRANLLQARADFEAQKAAAIAAGDTQRAEEIDKGLVRLGELIGKADAYLGAVKFNPDNSINVGGTVAGAGAFLPFPWNLAAVLGGAAITGLVQQRRVNAKSKESAENLNAATSIVEGIDQLRRENPAVAEAMKVSSNAWNGFDSFYTERAGKIVKAVRTT